MSGKPLPKYKIQAIRRCWKKGMTKRYIAKTLKVNLKTVRKYVRGLE